MTWFTNIRAKAVSDMLDYHQDLQTKIIGSEIDDSFHLGYCQKRFEDTFNFIAKQWCERRVLNKEDGYSEEIVQELNALELKITKSTLIGIGVSESVATEIAESFL